MRVTVAHNVMLGGGTAVSLSPTAPHTGTWTGNTWWDAKQAGNLPVEGLVEADPRLVPDAAGVVRPSQDGRATSGAKEAGMELYTSRPLTPADVGPASGR